MNENTSIAPALDDAEYNALYSCGGDDYNASGCYIPPNYCQRRM
jgi:hypothetical protein